MKKITFAIIISALIINLSCSKSDGINDVSKSEGRISLKLDKTLVPDGIISIIAILTRSGYQTMTSQVSVSDTNDTEITIEQIVPGTWHLKVNALDGNANIIYAGDSDVNILPGTLTQTSVTLQPTGSLVISVNWNKGIFIDNPNNPVFTNSNSPNHPSAGVGSSFILNIDGKYKMWYSGWYGNSKYDVEYAESQDGTTWQSVTNQPVMTAGQFGNYESYAIYVGPVIYENGNYTMYFTALPSQSGDTYIGMATSSDGINWGNAIIPLIQEDGKRYAVNAIVKKENQYLLYYSYTNRLTNDWGISLATSPDGVIWSSYAEKIMPANQSWELPGLHFPTIIYYQNEFKMVYGSINSGAFGLATSSDGFNWTKSNNNPIAIPAITANSWVSDLRYPNLIMVGNELRLYYTGMHNGTVQIGYAKLNL